MHASRTDELSNWVFRLQSGDDSARSELLNAANDRLHRLTSKMLKDFPGVRRWENTDDVYQNAAMRLHQALKSTTFPSVADFIRFASVLIRRELIDLSRHYLGPHGHGANQAKSVARTDSFNTDRINPETDTHEPQQLASWTEFHQKIEQLDEDEQAMFDLLWYQELTQAEAAVILGVTERTVQRRWQQARIHLHALLEGNLPDLA
jgi:RNA polymerase sigma factor (sigma-70 family)